MIYQRYRPLIPALLLAACCGSAIESAVSATVMLGGNTYDFALSNQHYAAFTLSLLTLSSFFFFRQYYRYFLGISLSLGLFNLVYFTAIQTRVGLRFGALSVSVNPALLLIGIITYLLNLQRANAHLLDLLKPSPAKAARVQQEDIAQFKERFARKSTEELTQLITANKLVPAALTAARQLMQERT
ncbi:MAG: hypothetical protein ACRYF0_13080 [Janthinobacterium lividum]